MDSCSRRSPGSRRGRAEHWARRDTGSATANKTVDCQGSDTTAKDVFVFVKAGATGKLTATVEGDWGSNDKVVYVLAGCGFGFGLLCDAEPDSTPASVTFNVEQGFTYVIVVDGFGSDSGAFDLKLEYTVCGDGKVSGGEECDDGNAVADGNGCSATCAIVCPMNWSRGGPLDHCYERFTGNKTWDAAKADCADIATEGMFAWVNGDPWGYEDWLSGSPQDNSRP